MTRGYVYRRLVRSWCWVCGKRFSARRLDAHHCSPRCRQRASRAIRDGTMPHLVYVFRLKPRPFDSGAGASLFGGEVPTFIKERR